MIAININSEASVFDAIVRVNHLLQDTSFDVTQRQSIFISVSEIVRNVLNHGGGSGRLYCALDHQEFRLTCIDEGPGIENLSEILDGNYISGSGLGAGLASVKRLMDELYITTSSEGTRIVAVKRDRRQR